MFRTHTCGQLRPSDSGSEATLSGWVHSRRDHGGVIFIDLRDRYGLAQVVFNPSESPNATESAHGLKFEDVIQVAGTVRMRPMGSTNPDLDTGKVELLARELAILSRATPPAFEISDHVKVSEEARLTYRYLDLRRPAMQQNLKLRHKAALSIRKFLDAEGFLEIETPFLYKSTPEGAREFLVPSRTNPHQFYALPQSPQVFKQILMVAGFDKYFQIVRCFRDEDLRADRQPEFTQVDLEMSFAHQDDILSCAERMFARVFQEVLGKDLPIPFGRLTYRDAMDRYGTDKPDLRVGMEIADATALARECAFKIFAEAAAAGSVVKGLAVPSGASRYGRAQVDRLAAHAGELGAKGLAWAKLDKGVWSGPIAKFFGAESQQRFNQALGAKEGDLLLFVADAWEKACGVLGALRLQLGHELGLADPSRFAFTWVVDFPAFFKDAEGKWVAGHHLFTQIHPEDAGRMIEEPGNVRSLQHDLVLNGQEIIGGSVRIHDWEVQKKVFMILGMTEEEARQKFGFFVDVLKAGAPPHGGIAVGFDRFIAILCGQESIREVIAFPKTHKGTCLMTGSPSLVTEKQLAELHIQLRKK